MECEICGMDKTQMHCLVQQVGDLKKKVREAKEEVLRIAVGICEHADDTVWISGDPPEIPETAVDALATLALDLGASRAEVGTRTGIAV